MFSASRLSTCDVVLVAASGRRRAPSAADEEHQRRPDGRERARHGGTLDLLSSRPVPPHRPLPKTPSLPRSSRRRCSSAGASATSSASRCAAARAPSRSSSTRARRPPTAAPAPTTCSRACSRTSSRATRRCAGDYVERKGGWDCHGLPVEIAVEQKLGFTQQADIERYGIAEFNAQCRESVFEFLEDWTALTERIGYWVDLEHPYRTLDPSYIESVWWALKPMWDKRPALRGLQGRALLPARRHRAVLARGRAGLRGRRGPVGLRDASR